MSNVAASVRARLRGVAKAQGVDFNQVLVRFASSVSPDVGDGVTDSDNQVTR